MTLLKQNVRTIPSSSIMNIEKQANDPLQVLGTQKKVSFDETNLSTTIQPGTGSAVVNGVNLNLVQMQGEKSIHLNEDIAPKNEEEDEEEDLVLSDERLKFHSQSSYSSLSNNSTNDNESSDNEDESDPQNKNNGVMNPRDQDILSGRGAGVNLHPGNVFFRKLISANKALYLKADPGEKKRIIRRIVERALEHGRFLKQDPMTEFWTSITSEEARKKTGQALRENGPAIKKQHKEQMKRKYEAQFNALPTYSAIAQSSISPVSPSNSPNTTSTAANASGTAPSNFSSFRRNLANTVRDDVDLSSSSTSTSPSNTTSSIAAAAASHVSATTSLLWSRMNILQEKQEQLKRKQRELEDEQHQLMQCFCQLTALSTVAASGASSRATTVSAQSLSSVPSTTSSNHPGLFGDSRSLGLGLGLGRVSENNGNASDDDSDQHQLPTHPMMYPSFVKRRKIMGH